MASKCEFVGCKAQAVWIATKLWGKGGVIRTCDEHKPGGKPSEVVKVTRPWYDVKPIGSDDTKGGAR